MTYTMLCKIHRYTTYYVLQGTCTKVLRDFFQSHKKNISEKVVFPNLSLTGIEGLKACIDNFYPGTYLG